MIARLWRATAAGHFCRLPATGRMHTNFNACETPSTPRQPQTTAMYPAFEGLHLVGGCSSEAVVWMFGTLLPVQEKRGSEGQALWCGSANYGGGYLREANGASERARHDCSGTHALPGPTMPREPTPIARCVSLALTPNSNMPYKPPRARLAISDKVIIAPTALMLSPAKPPRHAEIVPYNPDQLIRRSLCALGTPASRQQSLAQPRAVR